MDSTLTFSLRNTFPKTTMADMSRSLTQGLYGAAQGLFLSGPAVAALHHFHRGFRNNLGVSGKVACIVMPTFFMFAFDMQQDIVHQNKANWRRQAQASAERDKEFRFATPKTK